MTKCSFPVEQRPKAATRGKAVVDKRKIIDAEVFLQWAVCDQLVFGALEIDDERAQSWLMGGRDTLVGLGNIGRLGCRVDTAGAGTPSGGIVHPDAEVAYDVLQAMRPDQRTDITMRAWLRERPDWREGAVFCAARTIVTSGRHKGKTEVVWTGKDAHGHGVVGHCPIHYVDTPDDVMAARDRYRAWFASLSIFAEQMGKRQLRDHIVWDPMADPEPWTDEGLWEKLLAMGRELRAAKQRAEFDGKIAKFKHERDTYWADKEEIPVPAHTRRAQKRLKQRAKDVGKKESSSDVQNNS